MMKSSFVRIISTQATELPITPHLLPSRPYKAADGQNLVATTLCLATLTQLDEKAWVSSEGIIYVIQEGYADGEHNWFTVVPTFTYLTPYGAAMLEGYSGQRMGMDEVFASGLPTRFDAYLNAVDMRTGVPIGRAYPTLYARFSDAVRLATGEVRTVQEAVDVRDFRFIWDGRWLLEVTPQRAVTVAKVANT